MRSEGEGGLTDMNAEFPELLASVETFVAISVAVGPLKSRLLGNRHDVRITLADFFHVVSESVALQVILVPLFNHYQLFGLGLRQSARRK